MSVSYYAEIMFGVFLSAKQLDKDIVSQVRGCDHPLVEGTAFCSTCGKPMFQDSITHLRERLNESEAEEADLFLAPHETSLNFQESVEPGVVVGVKVPLTQEGLIELDLLSPRDTEEKIGAYLASIGIEHSGKMGLYQATYVSY